MTIVRSPIEQSSCRPKGLEIRVQFDPTGHFGLSMGIF